MELDLKDGLYGEILINMHGIQWKQCLDYWKIPFFYYGCHEVGHQLNNCLNKAKESQYRKVWIKKTRYKEVEKENVMKVTIESEESDKAGSTKGKRSSENTDPCHIRAEQLEEEALKGGEGSSQGQNDSDPVEFGEC